MQSELLNRWNSFLADAEGLPVDLRFSHFSPPTSMADVEAIEAVIARRLPLKFRDFILRECGGINVWWRFRDDAEVRLSGETESISRGSFEFNTNSLLQGNPQFSEGYSPNVYEKQYIGEDVLAFAGTPNGDQFAVILAGEQADKIVYLSHDLEEIHRYVVGCDFAEFLFNFARLGFVGPEFWVFQQFTNGLTTPIDANSPSAHEFFTCLQRGARSAEAEAESRRASEIGRLVRFKHFIEPQARRLAEADSPKRFMSLVDGYVDLLSGALKKRYEYYSSKSESSTPE